MFLRPFPQYSQPNEWINYGMELQMIHVRFLPPIEILRRVSNWSLHSNIEDEIQHNKNSIFIHWKAWDLQEPSFKSRSTPLNEAQALPRALIPLVEPGSAQKHNPRCTNTLTKRRRHIFMRFGKIAYVLGLEERDLYLITHDYKEIYNWFSQELTFLSYPTKRVTSFVYREEKKLLNHSNSGSESPLTQLSVDRHKYTLDRLVGRVKSCKIAGLTGFIGRPTNWVFLLSINFNWPRGRPIQAMCMSVDRLS